MEDQRTPVSHRQVAEFYDLVYYRDDGCDKAPSRYLSRLAVRVGVKHDQRILDVACGKGDWLATVDGLGAAVSGIDISGRAIDTCRQRMPDGDFHVGPAETLPFPNGHFDLVTCLGSLEHFLDQPGALREMARVTRDDGRLLILVPNAGFLTYRLGWYRGTQQQAVRETIRSLDDWKKMFASAGLDVMERWKDLHVLDRSWILRPPVYLVPVRFIQALALTVWPLEWQYQVFHWCRLHAEDVQDSQIAPTGKG